MANSIGVLTVISWGTLGVLGKLVVGLSPFWVLFICFSGAAVFGLLVCLRSGQLADLVTTKSSGVVWLSGLLLFVYHGLYLSAFHYAPAVVVSLINYLWPILVLVIGHFFFSLTIGLNVWIAVACGFAGISLLFDWGQATSFTPSQLTGYGLAFAGAVVWAVYTNVQRYVDVAVVPMVTMACAIAAVCSLLCALFVEHWQSPTWLQNLALLALTVGPAGLAFFSWSYALRWGNAAFLVAFGYSAPVISTSLFVLLGFERFSVNITMATFLVAGAGVLALKSKAH